VAASQAAASSAPAGLQTLALGHLAPAAACLTQLCRQLQMLRSVHTLLAGFTLRVLHPSGAALWGYY
jgi:hypothetical protein